MTSILTNTSAMTALQTLQSINTNLSKAQNEISTGKTISTAKDNAAVWSISKVMESDISGISAVTSSLDLGSSSVSVAREAAENVVTQLQSIQSLVINANGENVDKATLQTQIDTFKDSIAKYVSSAQFNGLNFLDASSTDDVKIVAALNRDSAGVVTTDTIDINRKDLSQESGGSLADLADLDVSTSTDLGADLTSITAMLKSATQVASYYGSVESQIEKQSTFLGALSDAMTAGVGTLVDADMEEASARLTALQTQQQLGIQALSIANQQPQTILNLFQ